MRTLPRRGLYAIVDLDLIARRGLEVMAFAEAVLAARPALAQLRAKHRGARETLALLRALAPIARRFDVPFFANDRPDLALLAGCDGVHVGQDDLPAVDVRRAFPDLLVGVSTHGPEQLAEALRGPADYVALGPIFATTSKENPDPVVGVERLDEAVARADRPVVAIGGIDRERAPRIARAGAVGAVLSDLAAPDPTARARELHRLLGGA